MRKIMTGLAIFILAVSVNCATQSTNYCKNRDYIATMKQKAEADFNRQDYYAALDDITQVKKCSPKDSEAYYWLGRIYLARQERAKALEDLNQSIAYNPAYAEARMALGMMLLEDGKYDEAIAQFKIPANNDSFREAYVAWNNMGYIYLQQGKLTESDDALRRSLALNKSFCLAYANLGELRSKQKQYLEASNNLLKAIETCPNLGHAHRLLGLEYNRQGKISEACAEFNLAFKNSTADSEDAKSSANYLKLLNCSVSPGK